MTTQNNSNKEEKNNIKLNSEEEKNGISITKTISSLISEEKELKKEQNVLSMKIKSSKNSYSKFLKIFNTLSDNVTELEKSYDTVQLKIASLKKKQKLILGTITTDYFSYFKPMCLRIEKDIYEGLLLFINYEGDKKEQLDVVLRMKDNLISLLQNSIQYQRKLSDMDYKEYKNRKNQIISIKEKRGNEIVYPFDILYDYFHSVYEMFDKEKESSIILKKIEELNKDKNIKFINLKSIEVEILKNESTFKNTEKYLSNIHSLLNKYKDISLQTPNLLKELCMSVNDLKQPSPKSPIKSKIKKLPKSSTTTTRKRSMNTSNDNTLHNETYTRAIKTISTISYTHHRKSTNERKLSINTNKYISTFTSKRTTHFNRLNTETIEVFKISSKTRTSHSNNKQNNTSKHLINPIPENKKKRNSKPLVSTISWHQSRMKRFTKMNNKTNNNSKLNSSSINEGLIKSDSKDSIDISDLNSVCDELAASPKGMLNHLKFNTSGTISNNNVNYNTNSYTMIKRDPRKINNKVFNFQIDKPVNMGGCCVSCT